MLIKSNYNQVLIQINHREKEKIAKGFGTQQLNQEKQKNKKTSPTPLASINEIQESLLGYVDEMQLTTHYKFYQSKNSQGNR